MKSTNGVPHTRQSFPKAVCVAITGAAYALQTERNMWIHYTAAWLVALWNLAFRPPFHLSVWMFVAICLVFAMEMVNTAVERVVELVTGGRFEVLAGYAKDVAAGASLCVSLAALLLGLYVGVQSVPWRWHLFSTVHPMTAAVSVLFVVLLLGLGALAVTMEWNQRTK